MACYYYGKSNTYWAKLYNVSRTTTYKNFYYRSSNEEEFIREMVKSSKRYKTTEVAVVSNDSFEVLGLVEDRYFTKSTYSNNQTKAMYLCRCKHCGNEVKLTKKRIKVQTYCSKTCEELLSIRKGRSPIKYEGRSIQEWSDMSGINYYKLYRRIKRRGMTVDEAISLG